MDEVDASRGLLITALGLFMYFEFEAVERLLDACAKRFRGSAVVFDAVSRWLSEASRKDRLGKPDGYKPPPWTWASIARSAARCGRAGCASRAAAARSSASSPRSRAASRRCGARSSRSCSLGCS
jgi:O-methyltransferase involved in polyketide biosynthesis